MHLPGHVISMPVMAATTMSAVWAIGKAGRQALNSGETPPLSRFCFVTVFLFLIQQLNFPIGQDVSGHFLGTAFAFVLLGVPFALLSLFLVLAFQAFFLGDGGISVLGTNVFNMAFLPLFLMVRHEKGLPYAMGRERGEGAAKIAMWGGLSVLVASLVCLLELALSGIQGARPFFWEFIRIHGVLALVEGVLTVVLFLAVQMLSKFSLKRTKWFAGAGAVLLSFISPLSFDSWDGLTLFLKNCGVVVSVRGDYSALLPSVENGYFQEVSLLALTALMLGSAILLTGGWRKESEV